MRMRMPVPNKKTLVISGKKIKLEDAKGYFEEKDLLILIRAEKSEQEDTSAGHLRRVTKVKCR